MWKNLLQFIYVNETFFKAKCSTSSFYIAAYDNSTSENEKGYKQFLLDTPAHSTQGSFYNAVTLKMRSRSQNFNFLFPLP